MRKCVSSCSYRDIYLILSINTVFSFSGKYHLLHFKTKRTLVNPSTKRMDVRFSPSKFKFQEKTCWNLLRYSRVCAKFPFDAGLELWPKPSHSERRLPRRRLYTTRNNRDWAEYSVCCVFEVIYNRSFTIVKLDLKIK